MSKLRNIGMWFSLVLASLAFLAAGLAKLAGVEQLHMSFAVMGLPVWFGYFIGACEVAGAVGIWMRKLSLYACSGLITIMLGAIYFHLVFDAVTHAVPAVILSLLLLNIVSSRKAQLELS
ncbi:MULTISPECIES: DoxX family protein [Pseudomonadati]|uniref:DoxX family protein n=1 Tax=Shewanella aestuarii TaxID=1028752 RepID=A0ABT0L1E9_9GAMM|nr:DoxX family protein [Shewanella aestuarii]MCL1117518.1 DoxX family protein [Shewanella aestuarii]GGN75557.1 hypothetical protein GCM10009193_15940 [Shewanella aestuarii]